MAPRPLRRRWTLDLPWTPSEHPLELITIPAFGLAAVVCFAIAGPVMMVVGFPSLGFGYWLPALLALVACESFVVSCVFFGLSLPVDVKIWEFAYVLGACAGTMGVVQAIDGFGGQGLRLAAGLSLAAGTWWIGTMMAWTVTRVFPAPDESKLVGRFSEGSIETIIGGRLRKTLYGAMEEATVHRHYARFFRQLLALAVAFSIIFSQYHAADPGPIVRLVSMAATWGLALSGLSLMAILGGRAREVTAAAAGSKRIGRGFGGLQAETIGLCATVATLAALVPEGISPIAAANFDGFSEHLGAIMNHLLGNLGAFTDVPNPNSVASGTSGSTGRAGMAMHGGGLVWALMSSISNVLWVLTAAVLCWAILAFVRRSNEMKQLFRAKAEAVEAGPSGAERLASSLGRLLSIPLELWSAVVSWLRFVLLPPAAPRTAGGGGTFRRFLTRSRVRAVDALMPTNPGAIIRGLYRRMVALGAKSGAERSINMTPEEYRRLLLDRARHAQVADRGLLEREVGSLTSAYTDARYTPRAPSRTRAQQAMQSLRILQAHMRRAIGTAPTPTPPRGPKNPGDGTGGFRL